ncbi:MAG: hypothetical protein HFH72_03435 [Lachnospiraceae bacterium]|nr:hypothetical protein [Lachnospiraceae bacterium]
MGEPFVTNVLSNKYDTALDFHVTMYDNLPYERDSDYCNIEKVALVSGRVIKFYLCLNQQEFFSIDNKDDVIEDILAEAKIAKKHYEAAKRRKLSDNPAEPEVSDKQIQSLLDDHGEPLEGYDAPSDEEEDELAAPEDAVNAFADVEDW